MPARGFTTLEAIVALSLLVTMLASLAQAIVSATRSGADAAARTTAVLLAVDKMEELRALQWTVDGSGRPVADAALAASPGDALDRDVAPYVDTPSGYVRRWAIRPLPGSVDTIVLLVRVIVLSGGDVQLATVRTRRMN